METEETYKLRGIEIQFPYKAYPCQIKYMESVIEALEGRKNALLESPTGNFKKLTLKEPEKPYVYSAQA